MGHIKNRTKTPKDLRGAFRSFKIISEAVVPDSFSEAFSDKNERSFCVQIYQPKALFRSLICWTGLLQVLRKRPSCDTPQTQTTAGLKMDHDSMIFLKFNVELRMVFDQASEEIQLEAAILLSPECSVGVQLRVISMRLKAVFF